jgi:hypothetical protein
MVGHQPVRLDWERMGLLGLNALVWLAVFGMLGRILLG